MTPKEIDSKMEQTIPKRGLSLIDLILVSLRWKKHIIIVTGIICVISIILYFFVFDLIFLSTATIKSNAKSSSLLGGFEIPDVGDLGDFDLGTGKAGKELASYEKILSSRRCLESLINKFGLMERDEYRFMEDAIKDFSENRMQLSVDKQAGILSVGVYDKDPYLAKEMVDFLLYQLDSINIMLNVSVSKSNKEFIEKRYIQAKEDLSRVEDSLKSFQFTYGIAPDLQIKASAQSVFTLEAELKAEEVKLDVIKKMLSNDQPEVKMQEAKVNSLSNKISEIQTSTDLSDFLRLGNSPTIAMSFLRLQRDVEIQTKILTFLLPLYEQAKIEEKRDTPTIIVLDKPYVSERKKKPKRLTMVLAITFAGFMMSLVYFTLYDKFTELKKKVNEEIRLSENL